MRRAALLVALLALACGNAKQESASSAGSSPGKDPATARPQPPPEPDRPTVTLLMVYGSEKKTWLEAEIKAFEATNPKTASGRPIRIDAKAMGSGEGARAILDGTLKPHVFSPASGAYLTLLNVEWQRSHRKPLAPEGKPLVLSPIVIAMWKPMAEALGWPGKRLGWADLLAVDKNAKGWGAFGRPEWGRFKLGHTHPEHSNSGLLAVLAEAYAGAGKTQELVVQDLDDKKTLAFLAAVEGTIVHYGKSTGFFAEKMIERGPAYLSAAVLYENLVIESYAKPGELPLVAIYPVEGTFWSDHPYSVLDADWVGDDEKDAAAALLAFLSSRPAQERALALGFRPADPGLPVGAPIDAAHGADAKQPETLLPVPDGATLEKLITVWRENKKAADVVLVFDKSGSMAGQALVDAKAGAKAFLDVLSPHDQVTLLFFDHEVHEATKPMTIEGGKADLAARIDGVIADGGTALYDATAVGYDLLQKRARKAPGRIYALVVMTDGVDEHSKSTLEQLSKRFSTEDATVKVFTIAYGESADTSVLDRIAEAARGSSARGSSETIVKVYQEMGSFF